MSKSFALKKQVITAGLGLLILADIGLAVYSWRTSNSSSTPPQKLNEETAKLKLLRADIERSEKIASDLPKTVQDCDKFENGLPSAKSASSAISAELGELAKKSGLQVQSIAFHDKEVAGRNITERGIEATISGNYESVVKFMNGLQRSANFYIVDSLELGTETQTPNLVRVSLHMRTYFRMVSA